MFLIYHENIIPGYISQIIFEYKIINNENRFTENLEFTEKHFTVFISFFDSFSVALWRMKFYLFHNFIQQVSKFLIML